jgi:hypothetical protein
MKKIIFALLCLTLLLAFTGCNRSKVTMILDFEVTDVQNIEIFKFIVPMEAKGMTVTESKDIEQIITAFSEIRIKRDAIDGDETVGCEVLSFRFNMEDGKEFVIAYWDDVLRNSNGINYKVSKNSLESLWNNLNYDKKSVSESELPIINK